MSDGLKQVTGTSTDIRNAEANQVQPTGKSKGLKEGRRLGIGLGLTSALTGFLVGTSSAPILGAMFTGIFGIAGTVVGLFIGEKTSQRNQQTDSPSSTALSTEQLGNFLIILSTAFGIGLVGGVSAKVNNWQNYLLPRSAEPFPWSGSNVQPESVDQALNWLCLQAKLSRIGYTQDQIHTLYDQQVQVYSQNWQNYQNTIQVNPNIAPGNEPTLGPTTDVIGYCLDSSKASDVISSPSYEYTP